MSAHESGDKIKAEEADQAPVQSSNDHQGAGYYVKFFHADFHPFSIPAIGYSQAQLDLKENAVYCKEKPIGCFLVSQNVREKLTVRKTRSNGIQNDHGGAGAVLDRRKTPAIAAAQEHG